MVFSTPRCVTFPTCPPCPARPSDARTATHPSTRSPLWTCDHDRGGIAEIMPRLFTSVDLRSRSWRYSRDHAEIRASHGIHLPHTAGARSARPRRRYRHRWPRPTAHRRRCAQSTTPSNMISEGAQAHLLTCEPPPADGNHLPNMAGARAPVVFALDCALSKSEAASLIETVQRAVDALPPVRRRYSPR